MAFRIERDGAGQVCVVSDVAEVGGTGRHDTLVLNHVVYDHATGQAFTVDPQKQALHRLSPMEAEKLRFCQKERPRAEADIFSGPAPDG